MTEKKTLKKILQPVCLLLFLVIGRVLLLYLIEPVDYSIFFNKILENKAGADNGSIDMFILGTSRAHRSFDPAVIERETGIKSVFNASSGLQPVESSYYLLRELIDRYHPKYAVFDLTAGTLFNNSGTLEKLIVLDRLHGRNKLEYLLNCFSVSEYPNALSRVYRFRNNFTLEKMREITQEKQELERTGYKERLAGQDLYTGDGFIFSYLTGYVENGPNENRYDFNSVVPENMEYLEKIISLCEHSGVKLFLVTSPWPMFQLYYNRNYQEFTDFAAGFAEAHGLSYVNLNYLRGREEWLGDGLMYDSGHVNGEGADRVSEKYARILNAVLKGEELPDLFYANLSELKAEVHRILALHADIRITDRKANIHITSTQSDGITPVYRVLFSDDDENYIPMTDWSGETDLVLDLSDCRGTAHFLIEAAEAAGEAETSIKYHLPI